MDRRDFNEAMRAARDVFTAGNVDDGGDRFNALIAELRHLQQYDLATTAMLEFGIHLASVGQYAHAIQIVDAAETLAIEAGIPTDRGDFMFAHAEIYMSKGDAVEATKKYVDAMEQYVEHDRVYELAGAASRYAFAIDTLEVATETVRAHGLAIQAMRALPGKSDTSSKIVAVHLGQIGRAHQRSGEHVQALAAFNEQREIWEQVGSIGDVASTDVEIGNVYMALNVKRGALRHWDSALALYLAAGNDDKAAEVRDAISGIDGSGTDFGPELS